MIAVNIHGGVMLRCDGFKCDTAVQHPPNFPHDLARLVAVNEFGWSHESSPYKRLDFCKTCSEPYRRVGVLEVELDGVRFCA